MVALSSSEVAIEQLIDRSMKEGMGREKLLESFQLEDLKWASETNAFADLGEGVYVTVYKGDGKFMTTHRYPFELIEYQYCEGAVAFLKHNYKRVRQVRSFSFLDREKLEFEINNILDSYR